MTDATPPVAPMPGEMADEPAIVLTDKPRLASTDPCPGCGAPAKMREASNGFGRRYRVVCGNCARTLEERTR